MMRGSDGMTYGGFWLMFLIGLLLVVLIALATYVVLRAVNAQPATTPPPAGGVTPSPREVLDLRLARGEISPEDYSATRPLLDS